MMNKSFISRIPLPEFSLWSKKRHNRSLISFDLEITVRCNNNCRHCYINLPAQNNKAKCAELTFEQIKNIINQATDLGALWCLITGGEPLLREDFFDIYLYAKQKGLLVSVFTNATLINDKHIDLFKKYPPRDIEITVYGVTKETYESVSCKPGSFESFMRGLNLLIKNGIKLRLKAMALNSNMTEFPEIAQFCRARANDYFRFYHFLHLRLDGNLKKNAQIRSERLPSNRIAEIEKAGSLRFTALEKDCNEVINRGLSHISCNHLFQCGAGNGSFTVSYDGFFLLCSLLRGPESIYDLKRGSLQDAYENFVLKVRDMRSKNRELLNRCRKCEIINFCLWCPAYSYLETGQFDAPVEYFCDVANARAKATIKAKALIISAA